MNVQIKKYRPRKNTSYEAELHLDGRFAAQVRYDGNGGDLELHFLDRGLEQKFYVHCRSLPPQRCPFTGNPVPMDSDAVMTELMEQAGIEYEVAKLCKKFTVFRLKGDDRLAYRTWRHPFSEATKKTLLAHYGDQIDFFYNERMTAA
jgi:hypothetical protein